MNAQASAVDQLHWQQKIDSASERTNEKKKKSKSSLLYKRKNSKKLDEYYHQGDTKLLCFK